jgi:hypothetical protein
MHQDATETWPDGGWVTLHEAARRLGSAPARVGRTVALLGIPVRRHGARRHGDDVALRSGQGPRHPNRAL